MTVDISPTDRRYEAWVAELAAEVRRTPRARLRTLVHKMLVPVYPPSDGLPFAVRSPAKGFFAKVYPRGVDAWLSELDRGLPAAVDVAVEVCGAMDPETRVLRNGLALRLWPEAMNRIAKALARSKSEAAFEALLGGIRTTPYVKSQLRLSGFDGGCSAVLRILEATPVLHYERVKLPTGAEWDAMTPARRERDSERRADRDPSDPQEVAVAEGLIGYLGDKGCRKAQPLIAHLYADHPSENIRIAAGHSLIALGDDASLDLLVSLRDEGDEWRRWFGMKALISKDPAQALQALGGEDLLTSPRGKETALRALDVLELDAGDAKKAKRKPWILLDRRWLDVAATWMLRGQEPAGYVFRHLPAERKSSALARARARNKPSPKSKATGSKRTAKKRR